MKNLLLSTLLLITVGGVYAVQAQNIKADTVIDITLPLSANDKSVIKTSFALTAKEAEVQEAVLAGNQIDPNDPWAYVSGLRKMESKRGLSADEVHELFLKGKKPEDVGKYLYRKELLEN